MRLNCERSGLRPTSLAAVLAALGCTVFAQPAGAAGLADATEAAAVMAAAEATEAAEAAEATDAPQTVVVIGQRSGVREVPGSAATIEQEDLIRARVFTVNEALRQAPGVYPRDEEGLGLRPNIGIRGLNPTRSTKVLLLEDGLPLAYAPYGDSASYYHPPIRRFERIEVLKGASQIRFGPGTIGGVINYVTPPAFTEPGGSVLVAGGNRGYREVDVTAGAGLFGFGTLLHANFTQSDSSRDNQALEISDIYLKVEREFGEDHSISLRLSRSTEDSQVTYSGLTQAEFERAPRGNPFVNDVFLIERVGGSALWSWDLADGVTLVTAAHGSWFDRDWWRQSSNSGQRPNDSSDPACGGMANLLTRCGNEGRLREYNTYGVESRLSLRRQYGGLTVSAETGVRLTRERQRRLQVNSDTPSGRTPGTSVNAGLRENNLRTAEATAIYLTTTFDFGRLAIMPGVRYEDIRYARTNFLTATPVSGRTELTEWVPGIGFRYDLSDTLTLYGGLHRGFAPPRVEDAISNTTGGSVDLDSEQSTNIEIGLRGEPVPGLFMDLAWFRLEFDNQIIPASVAGGSGATLTAAGETVHMGVEASFRGSARDMGLMEENDVFFRGSVTFVVEAEFAGARFSQVAGAGTVRVTGNRLPYAPEVLLNFAAGYAWGEVAEFQVEYSFTSQQFTDDLNTVPGTADGQRGLIPEYGIWNATLNVNPPSWPLGFYVTVKNLTDELTIADRSRGILPGTPRLLQAGITFDW